MQTIHTKDDLRALARDLGVRDSWHEPDEQGLTAVVKGTKFDNAGFWPEGLPLSDGSKVVEKHVVIRKDGQDVAAVNLATLLAFACDTLEDEGA